MDKESNQLTPCICQNFISGRVVMLGYMNEEAEALTLKTRKVTFFSRSKNRLWTKGERSGNFLELLSFTKDCDGDSILCQVIPRGPTCHSGEESCFSQGSDTFLERLRATINSRISNPHNESYIGSLRNGGVARVAQKVGEEGVEVALAGVLGQGLPEESADLLFHLLILLQMKDFSLDTVVNILFERSGMKYERLI